MLRICALAVILCVFAGSIATGLPETKKIAKRQITHEFKNKNYYLESLIKLNYIKAFMYCQRMGMQLLTIGSSEEYDYIYNIITTEINLKKGGNVWTSGTDMEQEGQFNWLSNGLPIKINKWLPGQPDNDYGRGEHCVDFWNNNGRIGLNDNTCSRESFFICESFKS